MDSRRIKQIIKEEMLKVLKEDLDPSAGHIYSSYGPEDNKYEKSEAHRAYIEDLMQKVDEIAIKDFQKWIAQLNPQEKNMFYSYYTKGFESKDPNMLATAIANQFLSVPTNELPMFMKKTRYVSSVPIEYVQKLRLGKYSSKESKPQKQSLGTILDPKAAKLNKMVNPAKPSKLGKILGT